MWLLLFALGCNSGPEPVVPVELPDVQVGLASRRLPAPVGIGTVGYGGFGLGGEPSPFAEIYPATTRVHNHPNLKAMVVSRGEGHETIWLRTDTVGIFQQMREEVLVELEMRLGKDLDDALIIGATHTHSGPGRVIDAGGPFDLIADRFFPEFYLQMVHAMADVVEEAYADLQPGRVGVSYMDVSEVISDRRCNDGLDYENATAPMIVVEQNNEVAGVLTSIPIHGTVLQIDHRTLSSDVSGAIEYMAEDQFENPVSVIMMNSWGGDMKPENPSMDEQPGVSQPAGYDTMERIGIKVALEMTRAMDEVTWFEDPAIWSKTGRVPLNRTAIGYDDETFLYDYGGVYCGSGLEEDCETSTDHYPAFDDICVPFNEEFPAPDQTLFSVGQLGPLHYFTFPGEPGTLLIESVAEALRAQPTVDQLMVFGYSQDYTGYSLLEDDWWQGGYEASGGIWGPRQGEYLAERVVDFFLHATTNWWPFYGPMPLSPFAPEGFTAYSPTSPLELGTIVEEPMAQVGPTDVVEVVVAGSDPWLGTPTAYLETEEGEPVLRPNGSPSRVMDCCFSSILSPLLDTGQSRTRRRVGSTGVFQCLRGTK